MQRAGVIYRAEMERRAGDVIQRAGIHKATRDADRMVARHVENSPGLIRKGEPGIHAETAGVQVERPGVRDVSGDAGIACHRRRARQRRRPRPRERRKVQRKRAAHRERAIRRQRRAAHSHISRDRGRRRQRQPAIVDEQIFVRVEAVDRMHARAERDRDRPRHIDRHIVIHARHHPAAPVRRRIPLQITAAPIPQNRRRGDARLQRFNEMISRRNLEADRHTATKRQRAGNGGLHTQSRTGAFFTGKPPGTS
jgi:hypothetical protein